MRTCRTCGGEVPEGGGHSCPGMQFKPQKKSIAVSAVWLHAIFDENGTPTDNIRVCLEIDGEWREVIAAYAGGHVSHCSNAHGWMQCAVVDIPGRVIKPATGGVEA